MAKTVLPAQFSDLEQFVGVWDLPTERQRNRQRLVSTIEQLRAFYDAMMPRMESIIEYLNQFPLDQIPDGARQLFYLTLSLAEVANAVELFKQPGVIDGFDPERFIAMHE
ncbi:MAG: hypothetical protein IVW54_12840 [Candidatus Binataceae bacterium]|nr:hypothetical protein [Candidatus Binataceae bacterium]